MSEKVDLLGQYISQVLIPRLNKADEFFSNGMFNEAITKQKSIIRALYRSPSKDNITSEEANTLKAWLKRIDNVAENSKDVQGMTKTSTNWKKFCSTNFEAVKLYEELDWEIWEWLHNLGYFAGKKMYGPKVEDIDLGKADEL